MVETYFKHTGIWHRPISAVDKFVWSKFFKNVLITYYFFNRRKKIVLQFFEINEQFTGCVCSCLFYKANLFLK